MRILKKLLFALGTTALLATGASPQTKADPPMLGEHFAKLAVIQKYSGQTIRVRAALARKVDRNDPGYHYYVVHDSYGDHILVRSDKAVDDADLNHTFDITGRFYRVSGRIALDAQDRVPILLEDNRTRFKQAQGVPKPPTGGTGTKTEPWWKNVTVWLITAIGVVLLILVAVLVKQLVGGGGELPAPAEGTTMTVPIASREAIENHTVKVLPGRFEVVAGEEKIPEVRLFQTGSNREYAIRRIPEGAPPPQNTIGFRTNTVSRDQGKLVYGDDGRYTIVNHADPSKSNAICVNGTELGENQQCLLNDQDMIDIGTVRLKYHAS